MVLFPAPEGPMTATVSPFSTENVTPSRTGSPAKDLRKSDTVIILMAIPSF